MGESQVIGNKKRLLEVHMDLIWDPSQEEQKVEEKENIGGNNGGQSEISEKDEGVKATENLGKKKKKDSKSKKSVFSKIRRLSLSKSNDKLHKKSNDVTTDAENNQKNAQSSSEVQEENTESTLSTVERSSYPEEAEFLEYVDSFMKGLKLEDSIEVDEVTEEKEVLLDEDISLSYIRDELNSVKEQEDALDRVAEILEPELRASMNTTDVNRKKTSDQLLKDWFGVVAKRHNLLERKYQLLRALENGDHMELELRTNDVQQQLHILMKIPENQKTPEQRKRHEVLWRELIELVNKRDEIVQVEEEHRRVSSGSFSDCSPGEETSPKRKSSSLRNKRSQSLL